MPIVNTTPEPPNSKKPLSEVQVRFSPRFAREERRRTRRGALFGVFASIVVLADATHAWFTHTMVDMGPSAGHLKWPPELVAAIALLLLAGSLWLLVKKD